MRVTPRRYRSRRTNGALAVEYVTTLWVFLLFIVFPFINLGTMCLRGFFLWFACEQATSAGSKARTWHTPVTDGTTIKLPADQAAPLAAQRILKAFPGVTIDSSQPKLSIDLVPITAASNPSPPQMLQGPLTAPVDVTTTVPMIRVQMTGQIQPLIRMHLGSMSIVGLTTDWPMTVSQEAVFENPAGLTI